MRVPAGPTDWSWRTRTRRPRGKSAVDSDVVDAMGGHPVDARSRVDIRTDDVPDGINAADHAGGLSSSAGQSRRSLVGPPVALALDVFAPSLAEIGRADNEDLEAVRPGLVASPRTGRDAHRV